MEVKRYPIKDRDSKVSLKDFKKTIPEKNLNIPELDKTIENIAKAQKRGKMLIWGLGPHVIKLGLSKFIIELMEEGFITYLATNGAAPIHDSEIALFGETSEDVEKSIKDGSFGFCEETGKFINETVNQASEKNTGYGQAIGKALSSAPYKEYSIFANAFEKGIPITCHVGIGTDITHMHPEAEGSAIGKTSMIDFQKLTDSVSKLEQGVYINMGSAVILPETFLKALSLSRNLYNKPNNFSTAVFDFIEHYRPLHNVIKRITPEGHYIKANHKDSIPFLAKKLIGRQE